MAGQYHHGELAVQRRAGIEDIGCSGRSALPDNFAAFAATARLVVLASAGADGTVWASLLTGPPGFATAIRPDVLEVRALPADGDPGLENLRRQEDVGLLVFDPATRRRIRVNGRAHLVDRGFDVRIQETYGNCRQYIQMREYLADGNGGPPAPGTEAELLSPAQQERIAGADTFFIATRAPGSGADASHRGGRPGFVEVTDARTLHFPDYPGNNFFNTLGNLELEPRAGLLFVDLERGDVLQLTGTARVIWDEAVVWRHRGAQRVIRFDLARVIDRAHASPLRMRLLEYSPFNP